MTKASKATKTAGAGKTGTGRGSRKKADGASAEPSALLNAAPQEQETQDQGGQQKMTADQAVQATPGEDVQGFEAQGEAKADAAHLTIEHNRLVDHGYLSEEEFGTVAETLQRNLATTISLYLKFKKYHWDIRGRFFRDLHLAYDEFIEEIFDGIDEQAERLVALGGSPVAAPSDIERFSLIRVPTETVRDARSQVEDLVADLTRVSRGYRDDSKTVDDANDPVTADLYNGYAGTLDKIRWMLQAMMDDDRMN